MTRYFFDTSDGDLSLDDEIGEEMDGPETARKAALAALPDMVKDKLPNGDRRTFRARVRDEAGAVVYAVTLTLEGGWGATPRTDGKSPA